MIFTSHMKPRSESTYPEYADYLDSLMADFGDVIILQLYGHDHDDSFLLVSQFMIDYTYAAAFMILR